MKLSLFTLTVAAGISLLTATPLLAQAPGALPAVTAPRNQPENVVANQDAKEKAEDAALLQQLDTAPQPGENQPVSKNQRAPVTAGRGGGGFGTVAALATEGAQYRGQTLLTRPAAAGVSKALLVRTSNPEPKAQAALEEDMAVMAHILNKAIEDLPGAQPHPMNALGVELYFAPGSMPMRSLYLDNYGAVFFLSVGFPLIAPPEKQQEEKPAGDSAWEDARQELYGQRPQGALGGEPAEDFSQEKVEKLKETLLESLKNASNIRDLKSDEFVTIWVSGGNSGGTARFRIVKNHAPANPGANAFAADQLMSPSRRTILTLRVSKADIDSYAKGKLSSQEFEKHARITTYTGDPAGGAEGLVVGGFYNGRNRF